MTTLIDPLQSAATDDAELDEPGATILLVDDNALGRRVIARFMETAGLRVIQADDGRVALETLEREQVDLVLLDLIMPEMDGFEVLRQLRKSPRTKLVPVIVMTGLDDKGMRTRALKLGAHDYLVLPVDRTELLARVMNHVHLKRARDEMQARAVALSRLVVERTNQLVIGDAKYRALVQTLPLSVVLIRRDGIIDFANYLVDGTRGEDAIGRDFFAGLPPDDLAQWQSMIRDLPRSGDATVFRSMTTDERGVVRATEYIVRLLDDGAGKDIVLVVGIDRSESAQATRFLKARETRMSLQNAALRRMNQIAPRTDDGFVDALTAMSFEVRTVLDAARVTVALRDVGAARFEFNTGDESGAPPPPDDAIVRLFDGMDAPHPVCLSKAPSPSFLGPVMAAPILLDGRIVGALVVESGAGTRSWFNDEEAFVQSVASTIVLIWTGVERWIASARLQASKSDLERLLYQGTANLRDEAGIAASAIARFNAILGAVRDGIVVASESGRITHANRAAREMFVPAGEELVGATLLDALHDTRLVSSLMTPTENAEPRALILDGREFQVRSYSAAPPGESVSIVAVFHDVTASRALERMKDDLLATVNHELRTPLTSLRGFAELLHDREIPRAQQKQFLQIILTETDRLTGLINDFLDIQKIEAGKMQYVKERVTDLRAFLERAAFVYRPKDANLHPLRVDVEEKIPELAFDTDRIRQVLANLLSNAVKFSPEGGEIVLSARPEEGHVRVSIRDHGIGIPEEALPNLFKKFSRVDTSATRSIGGSGLGLALIREIVTGHGGEVSVESEPQKGSTFSFTLPFAR